MYVCTNVHTYVYGRTYIYVCTYVDVGYGTYVRAYESNIRSLVTHPEEVTLKNIRTGHAKSISDPLLYTIDIATYLCGSFLDGYQIPSALRAHMRACFSSVKAYRENFNPLRHSGLPLAPRPDTTWVNNPDWANVARHLVSLFEVALYTRGEKEDAVFRNAAQRQKTPAEVLQHQPFAGIIEDIEVAIAVLTTENTDPATPDPARDGRQDSDPSGLEIEFGDEWEASSVEQSGDELGDANDRLQENCNRHASRLGNQMTAWLVEPKDMAIVRMHIRMST